MGNTSGRITMGEDLFKHRLMVVFLLLILLVAGVLVYVHSIAVRRSFSFNERVVAGYNVWMSVTGVPCNVVLKPWWGGSLEFNVTEILGWGESAVVPEVLALNNGGGVSVNITARGSVSPFVVYTLTVDVYTPMVAAGNLSFNLQSCSFRATDLNSSGVYVYVGLGDVYVNLTNPPHPATYSIVTQTGNILMAIPDWQGYTVNATTVNGAIHLEGANLTILTHNNQNAYGTIGVGGPHIYLSSVDGSITIETYPQS